MQELVGISLLLWLVVRFISFTVCKGIDNRFESYLFTFLCFKASVVYSIILISEQVFLVLQSHNAVLLLTNIFKQIY